MGKIPKAFVLTLVLAAFVVVVGGNLAMEQMSQLTGEDYAQVLAVEVDGAQSEVAFMGKRYAFDGTLLENSAQWLKLAIQSGIDKVKYIHERWQQEHIELTVDAV